MEKIVFLFGAGASIGALPIVNQIPKRLQDFISVLRDPDMQLSKTDLLKDEKTSYQDAQRILIDDLAWLLEQSSNHASVDTFAKKLYLSHDLHNLVKLKLALSVFFIYEQLRKKPDNRYDVFFASLLPDEVNKLPENIKIISWNYDYQFEMAYSEYSQNPSLHYNQYVLNVIAKYNSRDRARDDGFAVYKLNGATNSRSHDNADEIPLLEDLHSTFDTEFLTTLLEKYIVARKRDDESACTLSFAWEGYLASPQSFISTVTEKLVDTEIMIVIGYSFPFFNRGVDRKILGAMSKLKKIYIQSPEAENIQERFEAILPDISKIKFILKNDTVQFFLPPEL